MKKDIGSWIAHGIAQWVISCSLNEAMRVLYRRFVLLCIFQNGRAKCGTTRRNFDMKLVQCIVPCKYCALDKFHVKIPSGCPTLYPPDKDSVNLS